MQMEKIDVRDFLFALGVSVTSISGHNALFKCVFHNDRHPSARMDLRTTQFICDGCHARGNAISFLARLRGLTNVEARMFIEQRYGCGPKAPISDLEREVRLNMFGVAGERVELIRPEESWVEAFQQAWDEPFGREAYEYMLGRGFDRETIERHEIGFDWVSGRVVIPVRDASGQLVGFKGRAVDPDAHLRYLLIGDPPGRQPLYGFNTFPKSEHVFGLHRCQIGCRALIAEGELNVIAIDQRTSRHSPVGVAGSEFSDRQRALIVERCTDAVVWFDSDDAGRRGTERVVAALMPFMPVRVVVGVDRDAAEMTGQEIDDAVVGAESAVLLLARGSLPR